MVPPAGNILQSYHDDSASSRINFSFFHKVHDNDNKEHHKPIKDDGLTIVSLLVKTESDAIKEHLQKPDDDVTFKCINWNGKSFYSDYIKAGIEYKQKNDPDYLKDANVVMLFESPASSCATDSSFHNATKYRFHDWPHPKSTRCKATLGSNRYACMNGASYPVFLRERAPPFGLMEHWASVLPNFSPPLFVDTIHGDKGTVYAYSPVEELQPHNHLNDPDTHYHLAGKDAIHLMTQKTTDLLPDTRTKRPCVVKTTHSMGSRGIFIIQDDADEEPFQQFLIDSGNPSHVVVDFVDISRNVACHFFMHPDGSIVWFGSNENHRDANGKFSSDSYLIMEDQETLKEMQLPFVEDVVRYCRRMNFWGFCGIDVLFDSSGVGYLVDVNARVTGSCPALMALNQLKEAHGYSVGLFRRTGDINYFGTSSQLLDEVSKYNEEHKGESCVIIHSLFEQEAGSDEKTAITRLNIGVYGNSIEECKVVLERFAMPASIVDAHW